MNPVSLPPKPSRPFFSSGPCVRYEGYHLGLLEPAVLHRSHRSIEAIQRIQALTSRLHTLLKAPKDYRIALFTGSDTAAFEAALWNLIGPKPIESWTIDTFSRLWAYDLKHELKPSELTIHEAEPYQLPKPKTANPKADQVMVYCGTTTGVRMPLETLITPQQEGLVMCDATSAIFAYDLPWPLIDALSFSFQKGMGSEAGIGALVLSPKAVERLQSHTPTWPVPKLIRMHKPDGAPNMALFEGKTLNTPSMLAIEDAQVSLDLFEQKGGMKASIQRVRDNHQTLIHWAEGSKHFKPSVADPSIRSQSVACLSYRCAALSQESEEARLQLTQSICQWLAQHQVAFDCKHHAEESAGLRIWLGPTIETEDIKRLGPWLDEAFKRCAPSKWLDS